VAAPSRIGLLGDVHAEDGTLDMALRFFADAGVDHDPCIAVVDLAGAEATYLDVDGSTRMGRKETVPLPPPRGAH
jgi:hypothetical protein